MRCLIKMQFDPVIAKDVGTDEAIIYSNIEYWCDKNRANNKHLHDEKYWTYNSARAFQEQFNYLTEKQIRNCLKKLEEKGYLKVGNYNENKYDHTLWYACLYNQQETEITEVIEEEPIVIIGEPLRHSTEQKSIGKIKITSVETNTREQKELTDKDSVEIFDIFSEIDLSNSTLKTKTVVEGIPRIISIFKAVYTDTYIDVIKRALEKFKASNFWMTERKAVRNPKIFFSKSFIENYILPMGAEGMANQKTKDKESKEWISKLAELEAEISNK